MDKQPEHEGPPGEMRDIEIETLRAAIQRLKGSNAAHDEAGMSWEQWDDGTGWGQNIP